MIEKGFAFVLQWFIWAARSLYVLVICTNLWRLACSFWLCDWWLWKSGNDQWVMSFLAIWHKSAHIFFRFYILATSSDYKSRRRFSDFMMTRCWWMRSPYCIYSMLLINYCIVEWQVQEVILPCMGQIYLICQASQRVFVWDIFYHDCGSSIYLNSFKHNLVVVPWLAWIVIWVLIFGWIWGMLIVLETVVRWSMCGGILLGMEFVKALARIVSLSAINAFAKRMGTPVILPDIISAKRVF